MEAPQKVIPFRSHSCGFISLPSPTSNYILSRLSQFVLQLKLITWVYLFSHTYIQMLWHLNPALWWEMNKDLLKTVVYKVLGASQVQVWFSDWEAVSSSFHTSTFDTFHTIWMGENKYKTWNRSQDGHKLRPCSNADFWLKEMGPSLQPDPPSSFDTQVRWTLLADSCKKRLWQHKWERWHPDCENFDATRLQEATPNNHINGRQWA